MTLQKREKILLVILILVAAIVLPWFFLIRPQMEANQQKQLELSNLNLTSAQELTTQASLPELESQLQELRDKYENYEPAIPAPMKTYDIHYFVEDVCNTSGVSIEGLTVGEYEAVDLSPTVGEDGSVTENPELSIARRARVTLTLSGTFNQLLSTIDSFAGYGYIRVSQCSMDEVDSGLPVRCSLAIDVYAVLQPGDPEFATVQAAMAAQQAAQQEQAAAEAQSATE